MSDENLRKIAKRAFRDILPGNSRCRRVSKHYESNDLKASPENADNLKVSLADIPIPAPIPAPVPAEDYWVSSTELLEENILRQYSNPYLSASYFPETSSNHTQSSVEPVNYRFPGTYLDELRSLTSAMSHVSTVTPDPKGKAPKPSPLSVTMSQQQCNEADGHSSSGSISSDEIDSDHKDSSSLMKNASFYASQTYYSSGTPSNTMLTIDERCTKSKQMTNALCEKYNKKNVSRYSSTEIMNMPRSCYPIDGAESPDNTPGSVKKKAKVNYESTACNNSYDDETVSLLDSTPSPLPETTSVITHQKSPKFITPKRHFSEVYDEQPQSTTCDQYVKTATDQSPYSPLMRSPHPQHSRYRSSSSYLPRYNSEQLQTLALDIGFIDSHCHLDFLFKRAYHNTSFKEYQEKLSETFPPTYEGCIAVFCNPITFAQDFLWKRIIEEDGIWAAFGCHPHNAKDYNDYIHSVLIKALAHGKVRALGEIGLDYSNRNNCAKEIQHKVFKRQLKLAIEMELPLVIHNRDAFEDCLEIMKKYVPRNHKIHMHCCTDPWEIAETWLNAFPNLFIGLTNVITYTSAENVHSIARNIPLDRLLLETDAPYFLPRSLPRSLRWSHPGMAIHVAAQVAAIKNISLEETLRAVRQNTKKSIWCLMVLTDMFKDLRSLSLMLYHHCSTIYASLF